MGGVSRQYMNDAIAVYLYFSFSGSRKKMVHEKFKWYREYLMSFFCSFHITRYGRVAQLDRVLASEARSRGFESHLAHQIHFLHQIECFKDDFLR